MKYRRFHEDELKLTDVLALDRTVLGQRAYIARLSENDDHAGSIVGIAAQTVSR